MLTVDNGGGGGGGGLAVHYVIHFFFYPLQKYQFDNFNFNFTLILAAGTETARYQTIFRLATVYELLFLEFVFLS